MPQRFIIEDIEVQDCSGVIFRATDSVTGGTVAVRRFFPFGPTGGGLTEDEQAGYASALEHLETIAHPSLRAIVSGGCDPVDGIPFIATEWVEGTSLRHILAERALNRAEVTALLAHALEACEALSVVLGREGVWIETDPQTIIIGAEQTRRPITFWISPLRWLGQVSGQRGMEPLIVLTETAMGWSGEPPDSHGASGLAGWLKWLRDADRNVSLAEVRDRLTATVARESGPATHRPAQQAPHAAQPGGKKPKKKAKAAAWILGCCVLTAVGLAGWIVIQKNQQRIDEASRPLADLPRVAIFERIASRPHASEVGDELQPATLKSPGAGVALVNDKQWSKEKAENYAMTRTAEANEADAAIDARRARIQARGGVYSLADGNFLLERKGSEVVLEGRIAKVRPPRGKNGKTFFLEFEAAPTKDAPRAFVKKENLSAEMSEKHLKNWEGKLVRIRGTVTTPRSGNRPEIEVTTLSQITEP